jgi:hypothetical protein
MRSKHLLPLTAGLLAIPFSAQGAVHVVDDDGGPGVFLDLPAAITAAADGDVILVRDGTYSAFAVQAKGLAIVADATAAPAIGGGAVVEQLGTDQTVLVRGLRTGSPFEAGLTIRDNLGAVRVEDCELVGADGFNVFGTFDGHADGFPGADVRDSADVAFTACTLTGGEGADFNDWEWDGMGHGGTGLDVADSSVAVFDSTSTGGAPGSDYSGFALSGNPGGFGARSDSGIVASSGSTFTGGPGGFGGSAWEWKGCGSGGNGGVGFTVLSGEILHLDTEFVGGPKGYGVAAYGCGDGLVGLPLVVSASALETALPGAARGFSVPAPLRAGVPADLVLSGQPGDLAVVGVGFGSAFLAVPALHGVLLISGPAITTAAFVVPGSGTLLVPVAHGGLPAGVDALPLHGQALFLGSGGELVLGSASTTVALAPGL